jgi:hypothetical protein
MRRATVAALADNTQPRCDASEIGASTGGYSSALYLRGWRVRCVGPFFIVCVPPRAPDVGDVAGQDG